MLSFICQNLDLLGVKLSRLAMEPVLAAGPVVPFCRRRRDLVSSGVRMSRSATCRRREISRGKRQSRRGVILLPAGCAEILLGAVAPADI